MRLLICHFQIVNFLIYYFLYFWVIKLIVCGFVNLFVVILSSLLTRGITASTTSTSRRK